MRYLLMIYTTATSPAPRHWARPDAEQLHAAYMAYTEARTDLREWRRSA